MEFETVDEPLGFPTVLREGVVVAAILLVWATLSVVGIVIRNMGDTGSLLVPVGETLYQLFVVAGLANALCYVLARALQLSRTESPL